MSGLAPLTEASQEEWSLLLVDLASSPTSAAEVAAAVGQGRQPGQVLVAFGPHVQESLLEEARAAGFDRVLTRGQFTAQLPAILAGVPAG